MHTSLSGGCLCGRTRYDVEAEAAFHETLCYCNSCRRAAGAPAVAWFSVPRALFRWTGDDPVRFQSSAKAVRSFCGTCGTSLTYEGVATPGELDVTTCSLDDPDRLPPKDHTMAAEKLSWTVVADSLPVFAEMRTG